MSYSFDPQAPGITLDQLKWLFLHTPLEGKEDELGYMRFMQNSGLSSSSLIQLRNTGFKPVKAKYASSMKEVLYLRNLHSVMLPDPPLDKTVFILGLQNSIWEPGTEIGICIHKSMPLVPFTVSFTGSMDDLLIDVYEKP